MKDERVEFQVAVGVIAILRPPSADLLIPLAEALRDGGVFAIEVSPVTPDVLQTVGRASGKLGPGVFIGAGSVLTPEGARDALRAGARFVAAPTLNPEVTQVCRAGRVPSIPGAYTATEILHAWDLGASMVKVYPAGTAGAGYIREILDALPEVRLVAAGGITLETVGGFIQAGAVAVGVGAEMVSEDLIVRREFSEITRRARAFAEAVRRVRSQARRAAQPVAPIEGPDVR